MDPLTQGALGAACSLALWYRSAPVSAGKVAFMGALGGMAPDLDVLIRSDTDPLLAIEYHRNFTHSLTFIPVGGLLASLPWLLAKHLRHHFAFVVLATTVGYATHGLLDACTTYGTLLFWPWSEARVSWRWISVIDPVFTLPLLGAVVLSAVRGRARFARLGLAWGCLYMAFGAVQHHRADALQARLAEQRGHHLERGAVFPTAMNNVAWRSVYASNGRYYVDKLRVTPTGRSCATPGTSVPILENPLDDPERKRNMHPASRRAQRLIRWFSDGWVALDPEDSGVVGDLRYSFSPLEAVPIWGVRVDEATGAVDWVNNRSRRTATLTQWLTLVTSDGTEHVCL